MSVRSPHLLECYAGPEGCFRGQAQKKDQDEIYALTQENTQAIAEVCLAEFWASPAEVNKRLHIRFVDGALLPRPQRLVHQLVERCRRYIAANVR